MILHSDFRDWWDHAAKGTAPWILERLVGPGSNRVTDLATLHTLGYQVIPHGIVGEVLGSKWPDEEETIDTVVAYTDLKAHRGEGKSLVSKATVHNQWMFCSAYAASAAGVSWRHLYIGDYRFHLSYSSSNDWRSNCGESEVKVVYCDQGQRPKNAPWPLFAVDGVFRETTCYAIDLNIAPGVPRELGRNGFNAFDIVGALDSFVLDCSKHDPVVSGGGS